METTLIPRPPDEAERLAALRRYGRVDAATEKDFDLLTRVAAEICGVPYALISLVGEDSVTSVAGVGVPEDTVPREDAYCSWTVLQDGVLEIPDLRNDPRTAAMRPTVEGGLQMYAGTSLSTKEGQRIGTLCVMDRQSHRLSEHQRALLSGLARQVMALLELREHERMLQAALAREQYLASVDALTGLLNRRVLFERFDAELERSRRYDTPLTLVMVDLDHFKAINDGHGHAAGDAVLTRVGEIIRAGMRASDIAGRYGGEELCVILPQTAQKGAQAFAESLRQQIEAAGIAFDGKRIGVTASFGVAALRPGRTDGQQILSAADEALYIAKREGRNRVVAA